MLGYLISSGEGGKHDNTNHLLSPEQGEPEVFFNINSVPLALFD